MNPDALRQLITSCRKSKERIVGRPEMGLPSDWCPHKILNPDMPPGYYFTDASAWELIAQCLESGHPYVETVLTTPRGEPAIVLTIKLKNNERDLYVKVQVGKSNRAIGRSFHISYIE